MPLKAFLQGTVLCLFLTAMVRADGIDPRMWRGLDVHAEALPGRTWFNGLALEAVQLTGPDVGEVVARWLEAHRAQEPLHSDAAGWKVYSLPGATASEVVQVSRAGTPRAIWSVMALGAPRHATWHPAFLLPRSCKAGPETRFLDEGQELRQRTATCRARAVDVLADIRREVIANGLRVIRQWPLGFEAMAKPSGPEVFVTAESAGPDSTLLLMEKRMRAEAR